jgi:TetR/AcrR family transcriptional regulator, cholesterol catabolism regulator
MVKERILKVAIDLFWRYGVRSVTMDDIARELGISKKTIYQHFPDKDAIIVEVVKQELSCEKEEMQRMEGEADNPIDQVLRASKYIRAALTNVNPVLLFDLKKYHPAAWELFETHKQQHIIKSIRNNLEEGIQQGLYRPDLNVDMLARLHIHQIELGFDTSVFPPERYNLVDVQLQFLHHFLRGLLTEKGFALYNQYIDQPVTEVNNS